jgi:hypothetical protein
MEATEDTSKKRRTRRRRFLVGLALLASVGCIAWKIAERLIDVDRYRDRIATRIQEATGLPAAVGRLDLDILPTPRLEARAVSLGEGDFRAYADSIVASADLVDLVHGKIHVADVSVSGLTLTVPRDAATLRARLGLLADTLRNATGRPTPSSGGINLEVARVHARGRLFWGDTVGTPAMSFTATVRDPLGDPVQVLLSGTAPFLGTKARLQAEAAIVKAPQLAVEGTADVTGVELRRLVPKAGIPATTASFSGAFRVPGPDLIRADVSGQIVCPEVQSLAGRFTTEAWWDGGTVVVSAFQWQSPGLELAADVTRTADGAYACKIPDVVADKRALTWLASLLPAGRLTPVLQEDAEVRGEALLFGFSPARAPRFVEGTVSFKGLGLASENGAALIEKARGRLTVKENVFRIEEFEGEGITVTGTITPDFGTNAVAVDVAGNVQLSPDRVSALVALGPVSELSGNVAFDRLAGTFALRRLLPPDIEVRGRLANGRMGLATTGYTDTVGPVSGTFSSERGVLQTALSAESTQLGTVHWEGQYVLAERAYRGTVSVDLQRAGRAFVRTEGARSVLDPVLGGFGESQFDLTLAAPPPNSPEIRVTASRRGTPRLDATVVFDRRKDGLSFGSLDIAGATSLELLRAASPRGVEGVGPVAVAFRRSAADSRFVLDADLTACAVSIWGALEKRPNDPAGLRLEGDAGDGAWAVHTASITYRTETVPLRIEDGKILADKVEVSLAPLSGLLPEGVQLSGRVTGSIATEPLTMDLFLDQAGAVLSPETVVESVTGPVRYADKAVSWERMSIRAAGSDAVVTGRWHPQGWRADLESQQFDLAAVRKLAKEIPRFIPVTSGAAGPPKAAQPGELTVHIASLAYRRGRFADARAVITRNVSGTFIHDLFLRPYTGSITGSVDLPTVSPGETPFAHCNLQFDEIDLRILDELAFARPREFYGTLSGTAVLDVPVGEGIEPIEDTSGRVVFEARNGSLGKLGFATKVLTALKTLDLFRLRMPSLHDKGLTYDTCRGTLDVQHGLVHVRELTLKSPPMTADAAGILDFPNKASDVRVQVGVLSPVAGLVEKVPVLGAAADRVKDETSVVLVIQGSPYDPSVSIEPSQRVDKVKDAARTGGEIVKDAARTGGEIVKDAATGALDRLLGR